ncbi:hypothetical protein B0T19DRAFT_455524 [Cercophora scortea]|uniref:Uncharacterized protein n=1 Tax=Cercophora scortea TaxID=314031 RepID=A0AAE0J646_9PEZI|nr:hypothetical protein B0T19DRAFT_455524 [Cercophora scortea]
MYGTYGTEVGSPPLGEMSPTTSDRFSSGRQQLPSFLEFEKMVGHKPMSPPETGGTPQNSEGPRNPFSSSPSAPSGASSSATTSQVSPRTHRRLEPRPATSMPGPPLLPASVITQTPFSPPSSSPSITPTETQTTTTTAATNHPSSAVFIDLTACPDSATVTVNEPSPAAYLALSNIYRSALTAITQSSLAIYDFAQRCAAERQPDPAVGEPLVMPSRHMVSLMLLEAANIKRKLEDVKAVVRDVEDEREGGGGL